jgi:hypothetical protein
MEFAIALILFALLIAAWSFLPGTGIAAVTVEESPAWTGNETVAVVKA